jgi:hypothetical protein
MADYPELREKYLNHPAFGRKVKIIDDYIAEGNSLTEELKSKKELKSIHTKLIDELTDKNDEGFQEYFDKIEADDKDVYRGSIRKEWFNTLPAERKEEIHQNSKKMYNSLNWWKFEVAKIEKREAIEKFLNQLRTGRLI